jgi:CheY-like chemotaxis protein
MTAPDHAAARRGGAALPPAREILLIEGERVVAIVEKCILQRRGYSVHAVGSGEDALTFLEGGIMPDLILLDIELGQGIDGIETARRIRENHEVSIVFIADYVDSGSLAQAQSVSPYSFIIRDKSDESFVAYIDMVLRLSSGAREPDRPRGPRAGKGVLPDYPPAGDPRFHGASL